MAQIHIGSDTINKFTSIEQFVFREGNDIPNAVLVSETTGFSVGDTVMVYNPKGFFVEEEELVANTCGTVNV